MHEIKIAFHTDSNQNIYLDTVGVQLSKEEQDRVIRELCHAIEHSLRAKGEGTYIFSTPLPGDIHHLSFSYRKEVNPEYRRSDIFIFTARQEQAQHHDESPPSDHPQVSQPSDNNKIGIEWLYASIERDVIAHDRDARQLALILDDYRRMGAASQGLNGEIAAFVIYALVLLATEEDILYSNTYLIALRKLAAYYPDVERLICLLEMCPSNPSSEDEEQGNSSSMLERGMRLFLGASKSVETSRRRR